MLTCFDFHMLLCSHALMFTHFDDCVLPCLHALTITCPLTCMPLFSYAWMLWWLLAYMFKCFDDCMLTCINIHKFDIHTHLHIRWSYIGLEAKVIVLSDVCALKCFDDYAEGIGRLEVYVLGCLNTYILVYSHNHILICSQDEMCVCFHALLITCLHVYLL